MMLAFMITALTQVNIFAAETVNEKNLEANLDRNLETELEPATESAVANLGNSKINEYVEVVSADKSPLPTDTVKETSSKKNVKAVKAPRAKNSNSSNSGSKADLKYLSAIIFCEAGNQSNKSKVAVGNVILNRSNNKGKFGHVNTIKDVIYDKKWSVQFTPAYSSANSLSAALDVYENPSKYSGSWKASTMEQSKKAAREVLNGQKEVPGSYYYFNSSVDKTRAKCKSSSKPYTVIGSHIYY